MAHYLFLDYETFSLADLKVVGLDNYVKHPSTGISMLSWAIDTEEEFETWFPQSGLPPQRLIDAWKDPTVIKIAWNAPFEYNITKFVLPKYGVSIDIPLSQYRDPIVLAHALSLPGYLDKATKYLRMGELKDPRGDELKKMFCQPVSEGGEETLFGISQPLYRTSETHPKEFEEYVKYNRQDVRAMRQFWYRVTKVPFPQTDWDGWLLNEKINEFGMPGNRGLGEKALRLAVRYIEEQRGRLKTLTGLENPNSDPQMKKWAHERGYKINGMRAQEVQGQLDDPNSGLTPECREAFILRASARKSSYKKLERFLAVLSSDDRLRYQFKYMAAARTGRWAGGDVQVQNMARGTKAVKKKLDHVLQLIEAEDYDTIKKEFANPDPKKNVSVVEVVITILRSLFQAKKGYKIVVADLNAIENRVLGWAAGCWDILEVFTHTKEEGGDPYLSFGCRLFNKTYAEMWAEYIGGNEEPRQLSKPAVLGAGYGLGGGDLDTNENGDIVRGGLWGYAKNVCGVDMPQKMAHQAVEVFRKTYPQVVQFWTDLEEAFKQVLLRGGCIKVGEVSWNRETREWVKHPSCLGCVLTFRRIKMEDGGYIIRMELPSGRALHYINATIKTETRVSKKINPQTGKGYTYNAQTLYYEGIEHSKTQDDEGKRVKNKHKWGLVKTYGGKICENAVQAISRDILLHGMFLADEMNFGIFGLFHDELATEVPDVPMGLMLPDLVWCMSEVPTWAPGLLLGAEGYEGAYYRKG